MATSDVELINEVRALTGYDDHYTFDDADVQQIVNIGKEEIRQRLGQPNFTFYQTSPADTHSADRALFWFSCIGLKAKAGEIGAADLSLNELEKTKTQEQYRFWFDQLWAALRSAGPAETRGAASTQIERTNRNYSYSKPDLGGE